jgi:indole-3-glycerol phosphate synthase
MKTDMPSILRRIVDKKRQRLTAVMAGFSIPEARKRIGDLPPTRDFEHAIGKAGVNIIAELKQRSPSRGLIRDPYDIAAIHRAYERGGADAFSVLTEKDFFGGSLEDLKTLRELTEKPILRKDFLFDERQVYEARLAGADAILLIAAVLGSQELQSLLDLAGELDLACLAEVHTLEELEDVLQTGARVVGINNRDLHTFEVNLDTSMHLGSRIPDDRILVCESGITGPEDIRRLVASGARAFLVGEHLMTAPDPSLPLRALKEAL